MPAPKAVLFAFDGVISDAENVQVAAWERTFAAMGWEVSPERCVQSLETDDGSFLTDLFQERKISDGDVDGWARRKQALAAAMFRDDPRLYPGVFELIESLKDRSALAVVTTARRPVVTTVLEAGGLTDAIRVIIGREDLEAPIRQDRGHAVALARLGVTSDQAVSVESSEPGLTSAKSAGLKCLTVGHRGGFGDWVGSSTFLPDLLDRDSVLRTLGFEA